MASQPSPRFSLFSPRSLLLSPPLPPFTPRLAPPPSPQPAMDPCECRAACPDGRMYQRTEHTGICLRHQWTRSLAARYDQGVLKAEGRTT